jgi:phosphatidylglycerophosphatase A
MENNILNLFGLGKIKFSASIASALAIPFYIFIAYINWSIILLNIVFFILILIMSIQKLRMVKSYAINDPKEIIIDEFLGMYIILIVCQTTNPVLIIILLVLFRIIDNIKPFPFNWIEKKFNNELGLLVDDIAIGIVIGLLYFLVVSFIKL